MKTPRIEEMVEEFERQMPLMRAHGKLLCATASPTTYKKIKDWLRQALTQARQAGMKRTRRLKSELAKYKKAHKTQQKTISKLQEERLKARQAGIDKAVEIVKGLIDHQAEYGGQPFGDVYNSAYKKVIKALQDNK